MTAAALDRFFAKVQPKGECWEWTGALVRGYGRFRSESGRAVFAHRWLYEQLVAEIPPGLQLDHLCRTPACVNVFEHLEPVTAQENMRRWQVLVTRCPRGHAYDESNTYIAPSGHRHCIACRGCRDIRAEQHGTTTGYQYGCRCDECRAANTRAARRRQDARRQQSANAALDEMTGGAA